MATRKEICWGKDSFSRVMDTRDRTAFMWLELNLEREKIRKDKKKREGESA